MKRSKKKIKATTIKQKRWLKRTIELGNGTQAAKEVYNVKTEDGARAMASQNFLRLQMDEALEAEGLSDHTAAKSIKSGLEAMKIHGTNDNFIEIQDKATQHRYLETLLRLKGHGQQVQVNTQINVGKVYVELPKKKSVIKGKYVEKVST